MTITKLSCTFALLFFGISLGPQVPNPSPASPQDKKASVVEAPGQSAASPIRFAFQPIDFRLESDESPQRHAPETMAGGVAVFDYNNDGKLDIFFTNGADLKTLKKTSPKYSNRLFENNGNGPRRLRFVDHHRGNESPTPHALKTLTSIKEVPWSDSASEQELRSR